MAMSAHDNSPDPSRLTSHSTAHEAGPEERGGTPPRSFPTGRHLRDGTVRVFLAEALMLPTGLLTVAVLTRRLGPHDYGLFVLAATLVIGIETTISSLFSRATVKFIGAAEDWRGVGATVLRLAL